MYSSRSILIDVDVQIQTAQSSGKSVFLALHLWSQRTCVVRGSNGVESVLLCAILACANSERVGV